MITATQLRELRETLQDLIAVAPDTEAGRDAVLRAHNLNNVHNLDDVTPAENWYKEWTALSGDLVRAAKELSEAAPAYAPVMRAIDRVKNWCIEEEKGVGRFCGPANYRSGFNNLAEALKNTPAAKNPVQYTTIPAPENAIKAGVAMQAINNNLLILKLLSESKIGKLRIQLKYDEQPVPNDTIVLRLSWWQRNSFQVKKLINTLSRKKFDVKQEGKYLIICQHR